MYIMGDNLMIKRKENMGTIGIGMIALLMALDFALTWYGINVLGVIVEGNPIMVWIFDIDIWKAATCRLLGIGSMSILLIYLRDNYEHYKYIILLGLGANTYAMALHLRWLGISAGLF